MKLSKTNNPPRILLVGAGRFGEQHLKALLALEKESRVVLVGVVELNANRRAAVHAAYGVPVFPQITPKLLRGIDAVDVVTPPGTHYALVAKLLRRTNVFVEKPVTLKAAQALRLAALAKKNNRVLAAGHIYRHNAAVIKVKELLHMSGTRPLHIEGLFMDAPERFPNDCGILFSDLHAFDIFDFIFGKEPVTVTARIATRTSGYAHEDNAVALMQYPGDMTATAVLSWTGLPKTRVLTVFFPDKRIVADLLAQVVEIIYPDYREKIECFREMPLHVELADFALALHGGGSNYTDAATAAKVVNIVEHLYKSAAKKKILLYKTL